MNSEFSKNETWYKKTYNNIFSETGYTTLFQLVLTFTFGLIFAAFSYGFFYYLLFFIIFEIILVWWYFKIPTTEYLITRLGIFSAGVLGFILGRHFEDDHEPMRGYY